MHGSQQACMGMQSLYGLQFPADIFKGIQFQPNLWEGGGSIVWPNA